MSDSKPPTFKLDDDKDVLGRLCALSWFDGVRGEYELLVNVGEDDARELVTKLTAWLDAPRLAARDQLTGIVPVACCYSTGVALIQSRAGEWGVVDTDWLSMAPNIGLESTGAMRDWYATEAEARAAYRDETGKVSCESCARFIDRDDACVDADGIYTCADETACSAACAANCPRPLAIVDRPAPTPTAPPALDLDAVERELTASVRCGAGDITPLDSAREVVAFSARGLLASELHNGGIRTDHVSTMAEASLAAPALIAEVRALRAQVCRLVSGQAIESDHLCQHHDADLAARDEAATLRAELAEAKRLGLEACGISNGSEHRRIAAALEAL